MNQNDYIGKTLKPWPILVDHYNVYSSTAYRGKEFTPKEEVKIQGLGGASNIQLSSDIHTLGDITTQSTGNINIYGSLYSRNLSLIAAGKVQLHRNADLPGTGVLKADSVLLGADFIENNGSIDANTIKLEAVVVN